LPHHIPALVPYTTLFRSNSVAEAVTRVLVDQDRPLHDLRVRLETSGEIDGVANAGVGRAVLRARIAGDDLPRRDADADLDPGLRSEEHTSELQSRSDIVC